MKLQVLTDNNSMSCHMQPEHGMSLLLSTNQLHILLDTGPGARFMHHATQMGIDMTQIDYVFLSHGHNDHTGGLRAFLDFNTRAKVLIAEQAFRQSYFSVRNGRKDLSIQDDFSAHRHRFVHQFEDLASIGLHVFETTTNAFARPKANAYLQKSVNGSEMPDDFDHERILAVEAEGKLCVFSGCSHRGILNILSTVKQRFGKAPDLLIGGFHLPDGDYETEEEIRELGQNMKQLFPETRLYTGHCTGERAFGILQCETNLNLFYTGLKMEI